MKLQTDSSVALNEKLAYAAPAFALAVVGIPVYVYIPKFYTDVVGKSCDEAKSCYQYNVNHRFGKSAYISLSFHFQFHSGFYHETDPPVFG